MDKTFWNPVQDPADSNTLILFFLSFFPSHPIQTAKLLSCPWKHATWRFAWVSWASLNYNYIISVTGTSSFNTYKNYNVRESRETLSFTFTLGNWDPESPQHRFSNFPLIMGVDWSIWTVWMEMSAKDPRGSLWHSHGWHSLFLSYGYSCKIMLLAVLFS